MDSKCKINYNVIFPTPALVTPPLLIGTVLLTEVLYESMSQTISTLPARKLATWILFHSQELLFLFASNIVSHEVMITNCSCQAVVGWFGKRIAK